MNLNITSINYIIYVENVQIIPSMILKEEQIVKLISFYGIFFLIKG